MLGFDVVTVDGSHFLLQGQPLMFYPISGSPKPTSMILACMATFGMQLRGHVPSSIFSSQFLKMISQIPFCKYFSQILIFK